MIGILIEDVGSDEHESPAEILNNGQDGDQNGLIPAETSSPGEKGEEDEIVLLDAIPNGRSIRHRKEYDVDYFYHS